MLRASHNLWTRRKLHVITMLLQYVQIITSSVSLFVQQLVAGVAQITNTAKKTVYLRRVEFHKQTFSQYAANITEHVFRRMFRMNLDAFNTLCDVFTKHIGVSTFLPQYILDNPSDGYGGSRSSRCINLLRGHFKCSGGFVSGEVAVAIFLRLLSGGMCYDIAGCWGLYPTSIYRIFDRVLSWINGIPFGMVDIKRYLSADDCPESRIRKSVMAGFAKLSSGVLTGCIGVLDGWTPKVESNGNASLFTRKGYNAINVQILGDHLKRILWLSDKFVGSTHDSPAFQDTELYRILLANFQDLFDRLEYILADSAYSIRSFLQVPYPNTLPETIEDLFNCYLSKARIFSECVMGELCSRWGLYQRRMHFEMNKCRMVIRASAKIHNFLVDYREAHKIDVRDDFISFETAVPAFRDLSADIKKKVAP